MKIIDLNHSYTPPLLAKINQDLEQLLEQQDPDEATFLALANQRDDVIQKHLTTLSGDDRRMFVEAELEINGLLVASANQMFKASLNQLSGLVRGRKAVEKYK